MHARVKALYALFALSGFCGLIYESIWSHYLKLFVGHAAYAQTLVLAVFMGGMGLGAWLISRYTHRIRNLLWGYALVELIIGITAVGFHSAFGGITDWAYTQLLPSTCSSEGVCLSQWALAVAMILPQSILLGTTFPLMSGGIMRLAPDTPGSRLAALYFLNSIGAVVGVLTSGFVLIPQLGLPGAIMTAGIGNILLAVSVYFLAKPRTETEGLPAASLPGAIAPTAHTAVAPFLYVMLVISCLTGLSSFIYEVVWIRMLSMVLGSATHSFEIMLAAFILGLALGGLWIKSRIDRIKEVLVFLAGVQIVMGIFALLTLPLYDYTFDWMSWITSALNRTESGYVLYTISLKLIALLVMLPATFCAGMTLPLITFYLFANGSGERAIGQVYAANTIGAITGVLLTVHVLMPQIGLKNAMVVGAAIDIALGLYLLQRRFRVIQSLGKPIRAIALAGLLLVIVSPFVFHFDPMRMASSVFRGGHARVDQSATVIVATDGKAATVHLTRFPNGSVSLATNGKSDGAIQMDPKKPAGGDEITMTMLGVLPLVFRPDATEAAVIGFGTGMSSTALLGSPRLKRLTTIEIEPVIVEASKHFSPINDLAYRDPRHSIVIDDAKSYFARGKRKYDIIVSEPSNPWVSGVAGLFTEEFYGRLKGFLKPEGVLVQWLHIYEITPELVASINRAMVKHFPYYELYQASAGDLVLVASRTNNVGQPRPDWLSMPNVVSMMKRVDLTSMADLATYRIGDQNVITPFLETYSLHANSDYFPVVDNNGPKTRFLGSTANVVLSLRSHAFPLPYLLGGYPGSSLQRPVSPSEGRRMTEQASGWQIKQFLSDPNSRTPVMPSAFINNIPQVARVKSVVFTCEIAFDSSIDPFTLLLAAGETIPQLAKSDAEALWAMPINAPCFEKHPAQLKQWLRVFEAVARRDAKSMISWSLALLSEKDQVSHQHHEYLIQTAAMGHLLSGDAKAALAIIDRELPKLPRSTMQSAWVRLISSYAGDMQRGTRKAPPPV